MERLRVGVEKSGPLRKEWCSKKCCTISGSQTGQKEENFRNPTTSVFEWDHYLINQSLEQWVLSVKETKQRD